MKPKVTINMPFDKYLSIDAASKSRIWPFRETVSHGIYALANPIQQTYAMLRGQALEDRIQRPDYFKDYYEEAEQVGEKGKKFIAQSEELAKEGRFLLTLGEMDSIENMYDSVMRTNVARELLVEGNGEDQLTIEWEEEGIKCKARIDRLTSYQGCPAHVDLKITSASNPRQFWYQCNDLGYWLQADHYSSGTQCIDISNGNVPTPRMFYIVAVSSKPDPRLAGLNHHRIMIRFYDTDLDVSEERSRLLNLYNKHKNDKFEYPQPQPMELSVSADTLIPDAY